jgi:putative peptidoglycan lipid II flippase
MFVPQPGWRGYALRVVLAQLPLAALLAWGAIALPWGRSHGYLARLGMGLGLLAVAAAVYFLCLWLLGFRLRQFAHRE